MRKKFALDKKQLRRQFDRAAKTYAEHAIAYQEIGDRLWDKLEFIKINPQCVVDLGCGLGWALPLLQAKYPDAQVVGVDLSLAMLQEGLANNSEQQVIQADSTFLPFADESVDLIISNLMLPWCDDLAAIFAEVKRVLRPNGLFLFSSLGPDTLKELRAAWRGVDDRPRVHVFLDMHDLGDILLQSGLSDPVIDVEHFLIYYTDVAYFLSDLKLTGSASVIRQRADTLLAPGKLNTLKQQYEQFKNNNKFPATYEVVYGHAWKTNASSFNQSDEFYFPIEWLKRR